MPDIIKVRENNSILAQFDNVKATYTLTESATLQQKIRDFAYEPDNSENAIFMALYWVSLEEGITAKNRDWLWYDAHTEVGWDWHYSRKDKTTAYVYIKMPKGTQYFIVLKEEGKEILLPYISLVVEHGGLKGRSFPSVMDFNF